MDAETRRQSPIFSKTSDFILWLLDHTEKFPKSERFRLAKRIEDSAFSFYELLIQAARSSQKRRVLIQADLELEKLRLYVRLSQSRKLTNPRQYRHAAGMLVEIGRLLGGWLKSLPDN
jgi:four helix bundle protein